MLTVKHMERSGHRSLVEAESISYQPRDANGVIGIPGQVFVYPLSNERPLVFCDGQLFVMNDKGRTVDQFDLDDINLGIVRAFAADSITAPAAGAPVLTDTAS